MREAPPIPGRRTRRGPAPLRTPPAHRGCAARGGRAGPRPRRAGAWSPSSRSPAARRGRRASGAAACRAHRAPSGSARWRAPRPRRTPRPSSPVGCAPRTRRSRGNGSGPHRDERETELEGLEGVRGSRSTALRGLVDRAPGAPLACRDREFRPEVSPCSSATRSWPNAPWRARRPAPTTACGSWTAPTSSCCRCCTPPTSRAAGTSAACPA